MARRLMILPNRSTRLPHFSDPIGRLWIRHSNDLFAKLPLELRLYIFEFFFLMMNFAIHPKGYDCNSYCGKIPRLIDNISLLLVSKQFYAEARHSFLRYSKFHLHRVAFHGHQTMSHLPVGNSVYIRNITLWGDVAYRIATDSKWYHLFRHNFRALRVVKLNLEWTSQQTRMAPEFSHFIHSRHSFRWQAELHKQGRNNMHWKMYINDRLEVRVFREREYEEARVVAFLSKLNLNRGHLTEPINVYPLRIRFYNTRK